MQRVRFIAKLVKRESLVLFWDRWLSVNDKAIITVKEARRYAEIRTPMPEISQSASGPQGGFGPGGPVAFPNGNWMVAFTSLTVSDHPTLDKIPIRCYSR
jgi:hypothetical protein